LNIENSSTFRRSQQEPTNALHEEIGHLRTLLAEANRECVALKEQVFNREQVEVRRLSFLFINLDIAVADDVSARGAELLWNLFESRGGETALAGVLHRAMRGAPGAVRRVCPTCEEPPCTGCVRDHSRFADELLRRRFREFDEGLK
jgi:hypothetical protein